MAGGCGCANRRNKVVWVVLALVLAAAIVLGLVGGLRGRDCLRTFIDCMMVAKTNTQAAKACYTVTDGLCPLTQSIALVGTGIALLLLVAPSVALCLCCGANDKQPVTPYMGQGPPTGYMAYPASYQQPQQMVPLPPVMSQA